MVPDKAAVLLLLVAGIYLIHSVTGLTDYNLLKSCGPVNSADVGTKDADFRFKFQFKLKKWEDKVIFFYAQIKDRAGIVDVRYRDGRVDYTITCSKPLKSHTWPIYFANSTDNPKSWRQFYFISTDNKVADISVEHQMNIYGRYPVTCENIDSNTRFWTLYTSFENHLTEIKKATINSDTCYTNLSLKFEANKFPWSDVFFSGHTTLKSQKSKTLFAA